MHEALAFLQARLYLLTAQAEAVSECTSETSSREQRESNETETEEAERKEARSRNDSSFDPFAILSSLLASFDSRLFHFITRDK